MTKRVKGVKRYPLESQEKIDTLIVNELFLSINGEGPLQGFKTIILRLTGCNLRCFYCDTKYAFYQGDIKNFDDILKEIFSLKVKRVLITGGEPLAQRGTIPFIEILLKKGYEVSLETNGSYLLKDIPKGCVKVVDVKTPESGEEDSFLIENLRFLGRKDCLKFVIGSKEGFEFSKKFINRYKEKIKAQIHFSPIYGKISYEEVARYLISSDLDAKISLQIHKVIWGEKRGV